MKIKIEILAVAFVFTGIANSLAQTKLIEKVTRKGSELVISYEKYKLANGLTVLVHEDHSDPIVYVDVTYHVGSAREQDGPDHRAVEDARCPPGPLISRAVSSRRWRFRSTGRSA